MVLEPDRAATSARAKNKKGPKPREHVHLFRMKGIYSQKCYLGASTALCIEWAGYLVPWDALLPFVVPNKTLVLWPNLLL